MRKLATIGLAGMLAVAGLGMTASPSDAKHWKKHGGHNGISLNLSFGNPYPVYRPYRAYRPAPRLHSSAWQLHVSYCYDRWRSYREWDNTYQPFNGPRRECWSPYIG